MSWPEYRLDEIGTVSRGRSRHRPRDAEHLYGGPHPFVQTGDVKHAGLYLNEYSQTYSEAGLRQSKLWPVGTLCITIAANIAETAILDIEACFPDSIIGFIPDKTRSDAKFVKYMFDALLKKRFRAFTQGTAQDNLSQRKLLSLTFPVPGLHGQKRIASILSVYDDLIENNRRRITLLEEAAQQLYKEWFVRFRFPGHEHVAIVDGVPEGWERKKVFGIVDLYGGFTFKSKSYEEKGKYGIVTIKNIQNGRFIPECTAFLNKVPSKMKLYCYLNSGDILMSLTGNIGRVCLLTGNDYLLNQRVAKIDPVSGHRAFTYFMLRSEEMRIRLGHL